MTVEVVNQFLEKVGQDEKLQQELVKVLETQNNALGATELGAKYGYQFTADEFWQEIQHRQSESQQRQQQGDLSDQELESVAGGTLTVTLRLLPTVLGTIGSGNQK